MALQRREKAADVIFSARFRSIRVTVSVTDCHTLIPAGECISGTAPVFSPAASQHAQHSQYIYVAHSFQRRVRFFGRGVLCHPA